MTQLFDTPSQIAADADPDRNVLMSRVRTILADLLDIELEDELRYLRGWNGDDLEVVGLV